MERTGKLPLSHLACPPPHASTAVPLGEIRAATAQWVLAQGLLPPSPRTDRILATIDPTGLAARVWPTLWAEGMVLATRHLVWLFVHDDTIEQMIGAGQADAARALQHRLLSLLEGAALDSGDGPIARAMMDLLDALEAEAGEPWSTAMRHAQLRYLSACLWEADNEQGQQVADLATYVPMRRHVGGVDGCFVLTAWAAGLTPGEAGRYRAHVQTLEEMANDHIVWVNDVTGILKEVDAGATSSLVLSLMHERGLTLPEAIDEGIAACNRTLAAFCALEARLEADPQVPATVRRHVQGLRAWMRGHIDWIVAGSRFDVTRDADGVLWIGVPQAAGREEASPLREMAA